jgi:quercetin dioxygenase-like cupin family protein
MSPDPLTTDLTTTDPTGYALPEGAGDSMWFLDTRMTVKAGAAQTNGALTVLEWAAPLGFGPPRHVHHQGDEVFYLLDGEITAECGARGWVTGPGSFVFLPRGVPHAFVVSAGPVRGLQITSPAGFEDYLHELGRPAEHPGLPDPSQPDVARLVEAADRYGYEISGPPLAARPSNSP